LRLSGWTRFYVLFSTRPLVASDHACANDPLILTLTFRNTDRAVDCASVPGAGKDTDGTRDLTLLILIQEQSVAGADRGLDMENRALIITLVMQRWLALRLDLFGNVVLLGICLFGAGMRNSVNPAKVGVVLTYSLAGSFLSHSVLFEPV